MEYQVLARKWRPRFFADLIGQEHITKTLQNALLHSRIAHAYLFVGPRGIGKTTVARILAKAINCKEAPTAEPCDKCPSCTSINEGNSIDVIEIDGASNNSVDNIRRLREEVQYPPINSKYKIYIIDEVHMLSNAAWNALLKTLEEPPAHAKFIFATTEVNEVLPTVISRCQRFDLRKIPRKLISQKLKDISSNENVKISSSALDAIALSADGGMRDALSLLDQMIAFNSGNSKEKIDEEQILSTFGITSPHQRNKLIKAILQCDYRSVIIELNHISAQGKVLENLFYDILDSLRAIEITILVPNPDDILEVGDDEIANYRDLAKCTSVDKIQILLEQLSYNGRMLNDAINKHVLIETSLIKAMRHANAVRAEAIISKLSELRNSGFLSGVSISSENDKREILEEKVQKKLPDLKSVEQSENKEIRTDNESNIISEDITDTIEEIEKESLEDSTQKKTLHDAVLEEEVIEKTFYTPEKLWHQLIVEIGEIPDKAQLKYWMQEGKPLKIENDKTLVICYDEEFNSLHMQRIAESKKLLEDKLSHITHIKNFCLEVKAMKGIASPVVSTKNKDLDEVKSKILNNEFIQETIRLFKGSLVDFRG